MDSTTQHEQPRQSLATTNSLLQGGRTLSRWIRHYPLLWSGIILLLLVIIVTVIGRQFIDPELIRAGTVQLDLPPGSSLDYRVKGEDRTGIAILGTESQGRDVWSLVMYGTPLTLWVGILSALIGMAIGTALGFLGGFVGGWLDSVFRGVSDILITVPVLLILIVVALTMKRSVDVTYQALIIAAVVWMWPLRTIRAQVLSMRERAYVSVAQISGASLWEVIFLEMLPNLLPFLAASFASTVAVAMLTTIGMDALGLGPQNDPTLGNTIYWALQYSSHLNGIWWWWLPPVIVLALVFGALYLITAGLDPIANPRLRRQV